jgi:hypothetical protein
MHPMEKGLNGSGPGSFGELEKNWDLARGKEYQPVHVKFDFEFPGKSVRPHAFDVEYRVGDGPRKVEQFDNPVPEGVPAKSPYPGAVNYPNYPHSGPTPAPGGHPPAVDSAGVPRDPGAPSVTDPAGHGHPVTADPGTPGGTIDPVTPHAPVSGGHTPVAADPHGTPTGDPHGTPSSDPHTSGGGHVDPVSDPTHPGGGGGGTGGGGGGGTAGDPAGPPHWDQPPNIHGDSRLGPEFINNSRIQALTKNWEGSRFGGLPENEFLDRWTKPDGSWDWGKVPEGGFVPKDVGGVAVPDKAVTELAPGTQIDRFGYPGGQFLSPDATAFDDLHPFNYYRYEVLKPFKVEAGEIAPAFEQPGGGIQFVLDGTHIPGAPARVDVQWLIDNGYLKELPSH